MSKAKDDNTPSRVPQFKTIVYVAPFDRYDRESDYWPGPRSRRD